MKETDLLVNRAVCCGHLPPTELVSSTKYDSRKRNTARRVSSPALRTLAGKRHILPPSTFFSSLLYLYVFLFLALCFSSSSLSLIPLFLRLLPLSMTPCEGINSPSVNQYCFLSLLSPLPPPLSPPFSSLLIESRVYKKGSLV